MKLRSHLVMLVLGGLVPVLVFAGVMLGRVARHERLGVERRLQDNAHALTVAVDREIAASIRTLETLAVSEHVELRDFRALHRQATRVATRHRAWVWVVLVEKGGRTIFSTNFPFAAPLPPLGDRPYVRRVLQTGRSTVSDVLVSRLSGRHAIAVAVPVTVTGQVRYVVAAGLDPGVLSSILTQQEIPRRWTAAILDSQEVVIASTPVAATTPETPPETVVGQPASAVFRLGEHSVASRRVMTAAGEQYTSFSRSTLVPWTVAITVPASEVDAPVRRSLWAAAGGGLVLLSLALALALTLGRRIARPIIALSTEAEALGRGEPVGVRSSPVAEVDQVQRTLAETSALLRHRAQERDHADRRARDAEARIRRLVDASLLGVIMGDRETILEANDAFLALAGYSREDLEARRLRMRDLVPAELDDFLPRVERELVATGETTPLECELVRKDGMRVPVVFGGASLPGPVLTWVGFALDLTDRKRAERERERILAQVDAMLGSAPLGYAFLDRTLRYVRVNPGLAAMSGRTAEEHIGRTLREIRPDLADQLEPIQRQVLATQRPIVNVEVTAPAAVPWRARHYLVSYYPVRTPGGDLLGLGAAVVDITPRKRAERRLAAHHALTGVLAEAESLDEAAPPILEAVCFASGAAVAALWTIDPTAGVLRCVEVLTTGRVDAEEFVATTRALALRSGVDLAGRVWESGKPAWIADIVTDGNVLRAVEAERAGLHGGFAFPILRGETLGVVEIFTPESREPGAELFDMMTSIGSQIGQFVERTRGERERAALLLMTQRALRDAEASEQRYRFFVEAIPQLAWTADRTGAVTFVNRHWSTYTGLAPEESLGQGWMVAIHPEDLAPAQARGAEMAMRASGYEIEYRVRQRDGVYRWFLAKVEPMRDPNGEILMWLGTAIDIDAQKRAEETALQANRAKDEFLAMLSHELRTPLAAMSGWVRILRTGTASEATLAHAIEIIDRSTRLQRQMVDDLLDVSRIVAGKLRLEPRAIDLAQVLVEAVQTMGPEAEAKGIRIVLDAAGQTDGRGDPARLQQVMANLLSNAIKFSERGGEIEICVERVGTHGRISVRDHGQGIEPALLPHVFERFRQATGARLSGGLGLGLAIVKHIVELHGGTVSAESDGVGRGATFVVDLPL